MSYYCDVCDKTIKHNCKNKHFKSKTHNDFVKCKHIKLTFENPNINNLDEIYYTYIIELNRKYDYYLMKREFILIFNDNQYCPYITSELYSDKTMCYWYKFLEKVIRDFKDKGYSFNHIAEM